MNTEQDLLLAALAVQSRRISAQQFSEICEYWLEHREIPLADLLVQEGLLSPTVRQELQLQVDQTVANYSQCNATTISPDQAEEIGLLQVLQEIRDPEFERVLHRVRSAEPPSVPPDENIRTAEVRYRLSRLHGQGALGQVWLARDELLNRTVVIKEIRPHLVNSAAARQRFLKEAQITGQLEHPNIVPVHQLYHDDGRAPFYAMRFVGDRTLKDAIDDYHAAAAGNQPDPLELHRLLGTFIGICNAVGYAHSQGVIHRDLKPPNIALGEFGQVTVLDWGLAKVVADKYHDADPQRPLTVELSDEADTEQTRCGQILGTPAFMAPEQAAGRTDEIDARTDIYGLGAMLFAILTGGPPHDKQYPDEPITALFERIIHEPAPQARSVLRTVPPALDAICAKAMAREPSQRYAHAADLADDIHRWLAGEPVSAYREPWRQRLGRWFAKNRTWAQMGLTVAVMLVVTVSTMLANAWQNKQTLVRIEMENMRIEGHEMTVQLASSAADLRESTRFLGSLAAIRDILHAQAERDDQAFELARTRLGEIYEGILYPHGFYTAVSFVGRGDGGREIVRAERIGKYGTTFRVAEPGELRFFGQLPDFQQALELGPGEVHLSEITWMPPGSTSEPGGAVLVSAFRPVYEPGAQEAVGAIVVEMNLGRLFQRMTEPLADARCYAYVTDAGGRILADWEPGPGGLNIGDRRRLTDSLPALNDFFRPGGPQQVSLDDRDDLIFATKTALGPELSPPELGVVLSIRYQDMNTGETTWFERLAALVAALIAIGVLSAWLFSRFISRSSPNGWSQTGSHLDSHGSATSSDPFHFNR